MYYGARYYDPWVGRFLSQDPALIGPVGGMTFRRIGSDPQEFNAYSYVANRPTTMVDPTGTYSRPSSAPEPPRPPKPPDPPEPEQTEGIEEIVVHGTAGEPVQVALAPLAVGAWIAGSGMTAGEMALGAAWAATVTGLAVGIADGIHGLISQQSGEEAGDEEGGKENTADQDAAIQLAKDAKRKGGLTQDEAEALVDLANEAGLPVRGPESHPDRPNKGTHIHVGPVNHIPVR